MATPGAPLLVTAGIAVGTASAVLLLSAPRAVGVTTTAEATSGAASGLRYLATDAVNKVVISETGTPSTRRFVIDDIVAIKLGPGCQHVRATPPR